MNEQNLSISEFYKLINEKKVSTLLIFFITMAIISSIPFILQKKYKATGVINVYSSYFKNPMVREIIPELHAQDEIRYNVFALIKNSLNDKFLDEIGDKYGLFKYPMGSAKQMAQRDTLRNKAFDIITMGPQTFRISFIHSDPQVTKDVTQDSIDRIIDELKKNRRKTINDLMQAMKKRIEVLNLATDDKTSPIVSKSPELLNEELLRINRSLKALKAEYSEAHPLIQNLSARKAILEKWVVDKKVSKEEQERVPVLGQRSRALVNDLLKDFLKKYNYLRISYDVENKDQPDYLSITQAPSLPAFPFWPKKIIFYAIGIILGSIFSLLNIFIHQLMKESTESLAKRLESQLDTKFLGVMPHFHENLIKNSEKAGPSRKQGQDEPIKWN